MKQRNSFLILCFILISFGVVSVSAQTCMNTTGTFRLNSIYDANRRIILSSLPSIGKAQDGFFYNGSTGQEQNRVYTVGMCMPGSAPDDCSDCIKTASDRLIQSCPNQTEAYSWHGKPTLCHVCYSNTSFSGSEDLDPLVLFYNIRDINSNLTEFKAIWGDLVVRMIAAASTAKSTPSSSNNHYIAEVAPLTPFQNIYALMQCTPDLSSGDCDNCLRQSVSDYQSCCGQKQGGVVLRPSCVFRWEFNAFSKAFGNITVAPQKPPVVVPQPTSSAGDRANMSDNNDCKGISAGIVVVITVQTVVIILILFVLGLVLFRRRNSFQRTELQSDNHVSTIHSLQ